MGLIPSAFMIMLGFFVGAMLASMVGPGSLEHSKQWAQFIGIGIIARADFIALFALRLRAKIRKREVEKQNAS